MATSADVLRSVNAILQSGERREQTRLQTSLAMMEFAQRKRTQDINLASQKLQVASAANTQLQTSIASDFMSATGLGIYYEEAEEGKKKTAMTSASEKLTEDYGFAQEVANSAVSALWSYYEAQDPRAIVKIASNLGTSIQDIESAYASGAPLKKDSAQSRLFQSFHTLSQESKGVGDLGLIAKQAMKNLSNEFLIAKESMQFVSGDYDITSDIGVYEDIADPTEEYLKGGDNMLETEEGLNALSEIIAATKKDEPWEPGAGTALFLTGIYGSQLVDKGLRREAELYRTGSYQYLKQLAQDLKRHRPKNPEQGGLRWQEFGKKYGVRKDNVNVRQTEAMKSLLKSARDAGIRNTTSVSKASAALKAMQDSKFLSKAGKLATKGGYFAPLAGRTIGEAVADEGGAAVGQTAGTAILVNKVRPMAGKAKVSFITFLSRRFPAILGKGAALAMADSPMVPFGDIAALGLTAWEIKNTWQAWNAYIES